MGFQNAECARAVNSYSFFFCVKGLQQPFLASIRSAALDRFIFIQVGKLASMIGCFKAMRPPS